MIGKNIAPGIDRSFASEEWPRIKRNIGQRQGEKL